MVKSYWDERVFKRDTSKLLAYYKHAVPGSYQDGDFHNARYLVWKYKGKKNKLWRRLESKYGVEVKEEWEWPEDEEENKSTDEEVVDDLDGEEERTEDDARKTQEPDL